VEISRRLRGGHLGYHPGPLAGHRTASRRRVGVRHRRVPDRGRLQRCDGRRSPAQTDVDLPRARRRGHDRRLGGLAEQPRVATGAADRARRPRTRVRFRDAEDGGGPRACHVRVRDWRLIAMFAFAPGSSVGHGWSPSLRSGSGSRDPRRSSPGPTWTWPPRRVPS
jgi:hypothetical protein